MPPFGRPPRRRSLLGRLVRAVLALAVLGFLGLVLLGSALSRVASGGQQTSPSPTEQASTGQTSSGQSSGGPASSTPTAAASTAAPTTPAPSASYQNDSYVVPAPDADPPALPEPETYDEATGLLRSNALYAQKVPSPTRCEMGVLDLQNASHAQLESHLNQLTACLMRVWEPPLKAAGYTAVRPSVTVYSDPISTKCGKLPTMNASYCAADQQVYYSDTLYYVVPASLRSSRFITESVVAHEFGHAVQARSGILYSEMAWEDQVSKAQGLQYSRRLEMQADCLAGEFLGSVQKSTQMTDAELVNVQKLFHSIGDDVLTGRAGYEGNHGSGADRQAWAAIGMDSTSVGSCNTFTAPSSKVR